MIQSIAWINANKFQSLLFSRVFAYFTEIIISQDETFSSLSMEQILFMWKQMLLMSFVSRKAFRRIFISRCLREWKTNTEAGAYALRKFIMNEIDLNSSLFFHWFQVKISEYFKIKFYFLIHNWFYSWNLFSIEKMSLAAVYFWSTLTLFCTSEVRRNQSYQEEWNHAEAYNYFIFQGDCQVMISSRWIETYPLNKSYYFAIHLPEKTFVALSRSNKKLHGKEAKRRVTKKKSHCDVCLFKHEI